MRIAKIETRRFGGRLAKAASNARSEWKEREGILLRIEDEEGRVGIGEASPLPGFSPDTIDLCEEALRSVDPAGLPERGPEHGWIDWLARAGRSVDPNSPAARFAFETALLDLAARAAGESVAALLRGSRPEGTIPLATLIGGEEPETVRKEIEAALARGIATVKWKIGRPGRFEEELDILRSVRAVFGDRISLRLDANGAWNLDEGEEKLARLAEVQPDFVEQPIVPYLFLKLGESPVPVAADETLAIPGAAERLNLVPACRVLVLKPALLGGFVRSFQIAKIARARKYRLVVSHLLDGPVALAAAAELALAIDPVPAPCGLDRHPGLDVWPFGPPPQIEENRIASHRGPGLGVDPPEEHS